MDAPTAAASSASLPALSVLVASLAKKGPLDETSAVAEVIAWCSATAASLLSDSSSTVAGLYARLTAARQQLDAVAPRIGYVASNVVARATRLLLDEAVKNSLPEVAASVQQLRRAPSSNGSPSVASVSDAYAAAREALREAATGKGAQAAAVSYTPALGGVSGPAVRSGLLDALGELEAELDSSASTIADKVAKYFGMREVVLTAGSCPLQVALLAAAAKPLKPEVVVATSGVEATGIATQRALAAASRRLCTTLIPDSSVAALMARVDKVLLPAAGVCADGSVIVPPGSYGITLAAAAARVPVFVVASELRFIPTRDVTTLKSSLRAAAAHDPSLVLPADMASALGSVDVVTSRWDVLAPESVDLIITNTQDMLPCEARAYLDELYEL